MTVVIIEIVDKSSYGPILYTYVLQKYTEMELNSNSIAFIFQPTKQYKTCNKFQTIPNTLFTLHKQMTNTCIDNNNFDPMT